jgi:hypothetical protein
MGLGSAVYVADPVVLGLRKKEGSTQGRVGVAFKLTPATGIVRGVDRSNQEMGRLHDPLQQL